MSTINSKEDMKVSLEQFKKFLADDNNLTSVIHQAMDTYARKKWDEACNKIRFIYEDEASLLERHAFFTEAINPEFKP